MARIPVVGKSEVYLAHRNEAVAKNESNDCAVRAVAALTNTPYDVVHAMMARKGTPWPIIIATLQGSVSILSVARLTISSAAILARTPRRSNPSPRIIRTGSTLGARSLFAALIAARQEGK